MSSRVLIVDDEADMLATCRGILRKEALSVEFENKARRALERLGEESFDLLLVDIRMPGASGFELLRRAKEEDPEIPVIIMTAYPDMETAIRALRAGASDYVIKPFHPEDLRRRVSRALDERRLKGEHRLMARCVARSYRPVEIVSRSAAMRLVLDQVEAAAAGAADVLIEGEGGTGKELVARLLHERSGRKGHFVPVDLGAIPEETLDGELFGSDGGRRAGGRHSTPGLIELSHGGTLFLDEVAAAAPDVQAKLLRFLRERRVSRIGGTQPREVDVRVAAATVRDLEMEVRAGRFSDELFWRLNPVTIRVPPLRERWGDIPFLLEHFLPRFARELGKNVRAFGEDALEVLMHHPWSGNVAELQGVLQKALARCRGSVLGIDEFADCLRTAALPGEGAGGGFAQLQEKLDAFERDFLDALLKRSRGSVTEAAKAGGLPVSNLYWYLKKHGIKPQSFRR